MKKVRPWCGQPSDRGWIRNRTQQTHSVRLRAKFRLDRFILLPLAPKTPNFCRFSTSAFSNVDS